MSQGKLRGTGQTIFTTDSKTKGQKPKTKGQSPYDFSFRGFLK